jgi:hypothetical protein
MAFISRVASMMLIPLIGAVNQDADESDRNSRDPIMERPLRELSSTTDPPPTAHNKRHPSSILPETFVEAI